MTIDNTFLGAQRLLGGPWQALERDVARLMIHNSFDDVRIVGGTGDHGADILAAKNGEIWVVQCKHSTTKGPPKQAIEEVVNAAKYYGADRMMLAVSRLPGPAFEAEVGRYLRQGLSIDVAAPNALLSLVDSSPEYAPTRRALRDYQLEAAEELREGLIDTGRGQIVMATGLGKTVVMAEVLADLFRDGLVRGSKALVLAHTRPLVQQLHQSFWHQLPKHISTHHFAEGEVPNNWEGITFATVQTVQARITSLPEFGVVLVDEAHHGGSNTFQEVLGRLQAPMLGGVTATPWRGDGFDIDTFFGPPLFRCGIKEGLQRGFLCEVDYRLMADNLDWEIVQDKSVNKYSLSQLNRKLIIPVRDGKAAAVIRDEFDRRGRRSGILYSPTVEHARSMASSLRHVGLRAEAISADISNKEQQLLMTKFKAGEIDVITSVDMFNEGVDVPDVDLIVFMRATHSRRIFVQQLGRGLRLSPGKEDVLVLDFVSDLRRVAEVVKLDQAVKGGGTERLGLGSKVIHFRDESAGSFLKEWIIDQASLLLRTDDPELELPDFNFPKRGRR